MTMNDSSFKRDPALPGGEANTDLLAHMVVFEQYRQLLVRLTTLLILNRMMSFVTLGFVAISTPLSPVQLLAAVSVSIVIASTWFYERRVMSSQARSLADDLARQSGENRLGFYTRSQYNSYRKKSTPFLASYEPLVWFALTITLALFQYLFRVLLLH